MNLFEAMFDEYELDDSGHTNWMVAPMIVLDPVDIEHAFDDALEYIQGELGDDGEGCSVLVWERTVAFAVCPVTGRAIRSSEIGWVPCAFPTLASGRC